MKKMLVTSMMCIMCLFVSVALTGCATTSTTNNGKTKNSNGTGLYVGGGIGFSGN